MRIFVEHTENPEAGSTLCGGTCNLLAATLPPYGIHTVFVDSDDPENFRKAVSDRTKAIFIEALGNPGINVINFDAAGAIAAEYKVPLVVDSTFTTSYLFRPFEHGANVVVHSATKFVGATAAPLATSSRHASSCSAARRGLKRMKRSRRRWSVWRISSGKCSRTCAGYFIHKARRAGNSRSICIPDSASAGGEFPTALIHDKDFLIMNKKNPLNPNSS